MKRIGTDQWAAARSRMNRPCPSAGLYAIYKKKSLSCLVGGCQRCANLLQKNILELKETTDLDNHLIYKFITSLTANLMDLEKRCKEEEKETPDRKSVGSLKKDREDCERKVARKNK
ncbi:hypothetical protein PUN28_001292 [Cardiocondyla obscurior]|uniref:Uncharacterized protein n=1 Tax=Cardiocondyla obscurior TaxID=286306 RepID=A0AAW2H4M6_9HYME